MRLKRHALKLVHRYTIGTLYYRAEWLNGYSFHQVFRNDSEQRNDYISAYFRKVPRACASTRLNQPQGVHQLQWCITLILVKRVDTATGDALGSRRWWMRKNS